MSILAVELLEEEPSVACTPAGTILNKYQTDIADKIEQQTIPSAADVKRDYSKERMMVFYCISEYSKSGNADPITNAELRLITESMN